MQANRFDASYGDTPAPWDIGRPQAAFQALADRGEVRGRVLDAGCGTGEHALMAAGLGLEAVGVDSAPQAIERAERKARERGLAARFLVWDVRELDRLEQRFDTVLDCGLFHVLDDADRVRYVQSLGAAMAAGGRYHMLGFSDRQPGTWGPRRLTEAEIRDSFGAGWRIESIQPARLEVNLTPDGIEAWLAAIARVPEER